MSTPDPTYMPGTANSLFPIPNQYPWALPDGPTPIPTPLLGQAKYALKDWTVEDALVLIQLADWYAYDAGITGPSATSFYPDMQPLVSLSINEAKFRFPDSDYAYEIAWKEAVSKLFTNDVSSEAKLLVLNELKLLMKNSDFTIDQLDGYLHPKGFSHQIYPIENLKGDGQVGYLLDIYPTYHERFREDFIFLVTKASLGYDADFVIDEWQKNSYYTVPPEYVRDDDGDGIPEIIFISGDKLRIIEWDGNKFVDLSRGEMYVGTRSYYTYYQFLDSSKYSLLTSDPEDGYAGIFWKLENGEYKFAYRHDRDPFEDFIDGRFSGLSSQTDYWDHVHALETIFNEWNKIRTFDKNYFSITQDDREAWKLNLGFAYLMVDQETGLEIIEEVAEAEFPAGDPTILMAKTFLENFRGERTQLIPACKSVEKIFNEFVMKELGNNESADEWTFKYEYENRYMSYFCRSDMILDYLLYAYSNDSLVSFLSYLTSADDVNYRTFNVDGMEVALVSGYDVFILSLNGKLIKLDPENFGISDFNTLSIAEVFLPGVDEPAHTLATPEDYYIIRFDLNLDNPGVSVLLSAYLLDDSVIEEATIEDQFLVNEIYAAEYTYGDECGLETVVYINMYVWDERNQEFYNVDFGEYLLFELEYYDFAINILNKYHSILKPLFDSYTIQELKCHQGDDGYYDDSELEYPRLLYLLGLAYELNGNEGLAVQTYYRLWQEAPDSGYALMARAKLEKVD